MGRIMGRGPIFFLASGSGRMSGGTRKDRLIALLEPPVQALGYELVDLDAHAGRRGLLRVFIDRDAGVNLADCERVSRQLSAFLDVEDPLPGHYVFEVSSPGLDRRLRTLAHFERFAGHEATIRFKAPQQQRRTLRGTLRGVAEDTVLIEAGGEVWRVAPQAIESARLIPAD